MNLDGNLLGMSPALKRFRSSSIHQQINRGFPVRSSLASVRPTSPRSRLPSQQQNIPSTLKPIAALIAGAALFGPRAAFAADEAAAAAPAAASAPEAEAPQETQSLGAVVVRSRNRIEKLQDVPLSISVVTGTELARTNAYGIDAITKRAANVSWNLGNQRTSSLSIRGVGKIGQTEAQDPSVGVIVDGVNYAYNALTSSFDFTDVDTVEVTRGPQGTLLGKNTSLGVVNVTTRRPSFTPTADYSLAFNQRHGFLGTLAAGGPVVDNLLAWRGSFSVNRQEGDVVNAYNRDVTYTNTDRVSGRVQFLLTPTPDFNARLAVDVQPRASETTNGRTINTPTPNFYSNGSPNTTLDNGGRLSRRWFTQNTGYSLDDYYYGGADGNSVNNDTQRGLVTGSNGVSTELNWKLPNGHTITSITAYKDYHFNAVNDEGTPFDVYRNSGGFWNDYKQVSQELRISSPTGGFVDYQGGLYYIQVHNVAEYQRAWGNDAGAWFASNSQYATLDADPAGRVLLTNSLANVSMSFNSPAGVQDIRNKSTAGFAQANWHLSEPLTLTTGLRLTQENRRNSGRSVVKSNGNAPELNPASVNGVNLGGFDSNATGDLKPGNSSQQIALADTAAQKYFGVATYAALTPAQKAQIAAAKGIRQSQLGVIFQDTQAESFNDLQPAFVISPSYKINSDLTTYFSYQYGQKAGISQLVNGVSTPVKAEKTTSLEVGIKSALLDKTLIFNADVFYSRIKDYQQAARIFDAYTTQLNTDSGSPATAYTSATGNVPKVEVKGLEIDGVYAGIRNVTLRFAGAYNRAVYKEFTNSAQPVENGYAGAPPYRDVSGMPLAGAPKYTFNVGADYRVPVFDTKEFHTSANLAATSGYYSDVSLSAYSWIKKNYTVDYAIGLGNRNKSFDVSIVVKNLFNNDTPQSQTWNSYSPAVPRTAGIVFTGKL
jgi:outer membrane receptor protein involved in Fe transport